MDATTQARVEAAAAALRRGGLVAYPTETFYGLGALAGDAAAVARVAQVKGRPEGKPLPVLAGDRGQVEEVASLSPLAARLADAFWPGPLTLVVPARPGLPAEIAAGTATVGVRIPGSEVARALALAAGGAIVSTSANLAGESPPKTAQDLGAALRGRLDHVLDCGPTPGGLPSSVVAVVGETIRLVRPGAVPFLEVLACLRGGEP